jgi:CBS domain-containing protein
MTMSKAKEIMHWGAECVAASDTLETAARMMRDGHVGSLPICGPDNRLQGIITDRDIVVKCLAEGHDPKTTTAGDLAQGKPVWVDADADDSDVLRLMEEHQIRRLPVIEEHRLVGMISEADLATHLPQAKIAEFAYRVYSAPPSL